jgi:hypothetical protein
MSEPICTHAPYFTYKYVLMDNNKTEMVRWESGVDRIADLKVLPERAHQDIQNQVYLTQ